MGCVWLENFRCALRHGCRCRSSPSLHPYALHSAAASLFSLGAWPCLSPISSMFSSLPTCASSSLPLFRMQMADGFSFFLVSRSSRWSLSAIQPLELVRLITSTFWNWKPCRAAFILLKPSQFVENRLELSEHKQLLFQQPHYLPEVSCRITSGLLSACFVLRSLGSYMLHLQSPTVGICSSCCIWNLRLPYQPVPQSIPLSL